MTDPNLSPENARWIKEIHNACAKYDIPLTCATGLAEYAVYGRQVGGFLTAVLCNDLMDACGRADATNKALIPAYAKILYNDMPSGCYGSGAKHDAWIDLGGLVGREKDAAS
jgi:hypothetical protein